MTGKKSDGEIEEVRKGFGDIMGGKVLELESDRLIQKGKTIKEVAELLNLLEELVRKVEEEM